MGILLRRVEVPRSENWKGRKFHLVSAGGDMRWDCGEESEVGFDGLYNPFVSLFRPYRDKFN